jgi:ABC-type antimicrobial peptide transport system permease subunit
MRAVALQSVAGLAIGIPASLAAGHVLANELNGVNTFDWTVFAIATLGLVLSALTAGLLPAHRAASIEPVKSFADPGLGLT